MAALQGANLPVADVSTTFPATKAMESCNAFLHLLK